MKGFFVFSTEASKNQFSKLLLTRAFDLISTIRTNRHSVWQPVGMEEENSKSGREGLIIASGIIVIYAGSMLTQLILNISKD